MKKHPFRLRDTAITVLILSLCFCISVLMQNYFHIPEQVTTAFAFAVFLISLLTEGFFFGLLSAAISVLLVNFAFTFPYFAFNFIIPSNFFSAVVMALISVLTSTLTTQIKHHESIRAEAEKERMRANLLRAISHDLRTPLTNICGSASLLQESNNLTNQQQDRLLQGIQEDAQWLVRMVENLLSITRIDSGNVKIALIPTALDELIDSVIVKFRKRHPGQQLQLSIPEELVMIPMDPILIEQVLMNLLDNACQHGKGLTWLRLQVHVCDSIATFCVEDNGCGVDSARLPHLFTGTHVNSSAPSDNAKGNAGIGLSVCATIIRAHGGTIQAKNRPEGGARFSFTLKTEEPHDE